MMSDSFVSINNGKRTFTTEKKKKRTKQNLFRDSSLACGFAFIRIVAKITCP